MERDAARSKEERLCRLCATITTHPNQRVDIFAGDGLRSKIETCLPVHVFKESLLPDTLCSSCNEKICAFYNFRKRSLETLKILEENFHVVRSCFVSSSADLTDKSDKTTSTDNLDVEGSEFEEWRCKKLANFHYETDSLAIKQQNNRKLVNCALEIEKANRLLAHGTVNSTGSSKLVEYDSSDGEGQDPDNACVQNVHTMFKNKMYFDDKVNDFISEIVERKSTKRKFETVEAIGEGFDDNRRKMFKPNLADMFTGDSSRRKKRPPVKREVRSLENVELQQQQHQAPLLSYSNHSVAPPMPVGRHNINSLMNSNKSFNERQRFDMVKAEVVNVPMPQVCLLCDQQFSKGSALARHVFDTHGIDMAQVLSSEPVPEGMTRTLHQNLQNLQQEYYAESINMQVHATEVTPKSPKSPKVAVSSAEKKKKLPELVKITDLKSKRESIDMKHVENDAPPTLTASYVCPLCPASLTNKTDLYAHLRIRHSTHAKLICGLCLYTASSVHNLQEHVDTCQKSHSLIGYFICQVCKYSEDNQKSLENHVLVHDFLMIDSKKDGKIFDPADFVDINESAEAKYYTCTECGVALSSFKEFSSHKRSMHQIFHCDLCNKSYGRNSHLWKHVNRVHKGHPSVTCQFCYKTSASKYHLLQHFNKIHTQKSSESRVTAIASTNSNTGGRIKNGEVPLPLPDVEEDDFMSKKFEGFDFQSVRQSFMRAELAEAAAEKYKDNIPEEKEKQMRKVTEFRDLSVLKMPAVPPKELDSSSTIYTNIITNYTPPTNDGEYKCPKCAKGFHKRTLLKKHKKNCRPRLQKDLLTRCKSCSRIFKDRQSLAKHLVNYHSEYSCEMCAEKVQSKCEIVSHIRFTHPGCHLFCRDCGNVLRNNDLLRAHLQDHANSFVCQFCGDVLPSKIKLKMHILSLHRKILSLSCGVCLKLFESQHILRDHVRLVHREALQPLTSCTVCGKNYGSKWKTYDHLNKSHGRVFKACKSCLEVFNNDQELQAHVDMHHSKGMKKYVPNEIEQAHAQVTVPTTPKPPEPKITVKEENHNISQEEPMEEDESEEEVRDEYEGKSILEKHLVGAYNVQRVNNNQSNAKQNGLSSSYAAPSIPKTAKQHADELNSSKRTVYVNSNDPSVCDICFKKWPAKKHLWQHYIRCHKTVAATVCGICLKTNSTYEELQRHLHREHPTLLHGKGFGSNFICRICGRYHNASSKLRLHMAIHIKFDWGLLGQLENNIQTKNNEVQQQEDEEEEDDDEDQEEEETKVKEEIITEGEVNFESMMEQVEGSTNSSSSSESDDDDDDDDDEDDDNEEEEDEEEEEEEDDNNDDEDQEEEEEKVQQVIKHEDNRSESIEEQQVEEEENDENDEEEEEDEDDEEEEEEEEDDDQEEVTEEQGEIIKAEEHEEQMEEDVEGEEGEEYEVVEEMVHQGEITIYQEEEVMQEEQEVYADEEGEEEEEEQIVISEVIEEGEVELEDNDEVLEEDEDYEEGDDDDNDDNDDGDDDDDDGDDDGGGQEYVPDEAQNQAVQSICYDEDSCQANEVVEEYEVQTHNTSLNTQHEIQSAVDSIL